MITFASLITYAQILLRKIFCSRNLCKNFLLRHHRLNQVYKTTDKTQKNQYDPRKDTWKLSFFM